jgi:hypothetical protein
VNSWRTSRPRNIENKELAEANLSDSLPQKTKRECSSAQGRTLQTQRKFPPGGSKDRNKTYYTLSACSIGLYSFFILFSFSFSFSIAFPCCAKQNVRL